MKKEKPKKEMSFQEKLVENIKTFFSAYLIAFFIRLFFLEAYQIPSQSMVPNLLVRDILMVEKVTMGSKIPILQWKIPGIIKPKRNDIIVFVSPAWSSPGLSREIISLLTLSVINLDNTFETPKNLVKRLVALPGDRIFMSNQILFINGEKVETKSVGVVKQSILERFKKVGEEEFHIYEEKYDGQKRVVQYLSQLEGLTQLDYSNAMLFLTNEVILSRFDFYRNYLLANFPEIYVPKKGDVIEISKINPYFKYLMKLLIERESGKKVTIKGDKIYFGNEEIKQWMVKENYYFAMGDNRHLSEDSRYFGFIPESNIFGKPFFRYFPFLRIGFNFNEKANRIIGKSL